MLLTRQSRRARRPELQMASMIDVVFLLLIFFMCTSSFPKLENDMAAQLPHSGSGDAALEEDFEPIRVRLAPMGESGVLLSVDGRACGSFPALLEALRARRAVADLPVIIEAESTVLFGHMVSALDSCHQADLRRVAFSRRGMAK